MKNIFTLLLVAGCFANTLAQEIDIKKDVVLLNGEEVFKINGGALSTTFSVENMEGKKLIFLKVDNNNKNENGTSPYLVTFAGYKDISGSFQGSIPVKKSIAKEIINNDLLVNGELNEENVYRYCGAANTSKRRMSNARTTNTYYNPVERNTDAPIFTAGGNIRQDNKLVGKHKRKTSSKAGKQQKTINIFGADDTPIADITYVVFEEEAEMFLYSNEKTSTISIPNANDIAVLEDVIKYLIDMGKL